MLKQNKKELRRCREETPKENRLVISKTDTRESPDEITWKLDYRLEICLSTGEGKTAEASATGVLNFINEIFAEHSR